MPLSPKNKIYFGVVACGVAALVTDRLTRSPDDSAASASSVSPASLLVTPSERAAAVSPMSQPSANAMTAAELLRSAAQKSGWTFGNSTEPHNPFANDDAAPQAKHAHPSETAAVFTQSHHLTAVISTDGQSRAMASHAMVDGQIYSVGSVIDGFTLVAVSLRSAVFQQGGQRAVLVMQGYSPIPDSSGKIAPPLSAGL